MVRFRIHVHFIEKGQAEKLKGVMFSMWKLLRHISRKEKCKVWTQPVGGEEA